VDAALDQALYALLAVLGERLAKTVESADAVPFGVHHAVAVLVADRAAFREASDGNLLMPFCNAVRDSILPPPVT
jgi:hypothetical protein